jgi:hypothetical protein
MHVIIDNTQGGDPNATLAEPRHMTPLEAAVARLREWLWRLSRKFPRLVWYGDELDVRLTFDGRGLGTDADAIFECQRILREAGISFDSGSGLEGRDWELDWSLQGPLRVTFRGRASKPELRVARPRPTVVAA